MTWWGSGHWAPWWERAARWWYDDHLWHWWRVWHYTGGWGSLGTIIVAVLAILASTLYNRRTLRQARVIGDATIGVMWQQRADLRGDVLRTELARWLTVVSEIERTSGEMLRRAQESNLTRHDTGEPLDAAEIDRRIAALKSIVKQVISEPLTNYATQGTQIQMLTADESILTNIHFITQAIIGKTQNLNSVIDTLDSTARRPPEEHKQELNNLVFSLVLAVSQDYQYTRQINVARSDLINHVIGRFNPAAVETVARVNRKYPNVLQQLQPTSIIRPQRPQSQPTGAETQPTDAVQPTDAAASDEMDAITAPIRRTGSNT